jgi:hypothetical protein
LKQITPNLARLLEAQQAAVQSLQASAVGDRGRDLSQQSTAGRSIRLRSSARRRRVGAAAQGLLPGDSPRQPEQGRDFVRRAWAKAGRARGDRLADEQKIMAAQGDQGQAREEAKPRLKGRIEMDDAYLGG